MPTLNNDRSPLTIAAHGGVTVGVLKVVQDLLVLPSETAADTVAVACYWKDVEVLSAGKTTGEAWAVGQKLYWDPATSKFTTTAGALVVRAFASAVAASGDTTGSVILFGAVD